MEADTAALTQVDTPPTNGDVPAVPELPPPTQQELAALSDWCAYTKIMYNRLSMSESPYAEFMSDMLSIFEPLIESAKGQ